jgi:uridylate kinase
MNLPYKRVLLKISGEALACIENREIGYCIAQNILEKVANDVKSVYEMGIQIAIVIGGGNIYRGIKGTNSHGIDRCASDYMGMLATIINGVALHSAIEKSGVPARLMSALPIPSVCEQFTFHKASHHMKKDRVLVFAGGTGNPYFTTDTAATLRAAEMKCDLLLKATKVKGVFCSDPNLNPNAQFFKNLTYTQVSEKKLAVMDSTAITFAAENSIPIAVFSIFEENGFKKVMDNACDFTLIN